ARTRRCPPSRRSRAGTRSARAALRGRSRPANRQPSTPCANVFLVRAVPATVDRLLRPLHRRVWADANRRARKLLRFADTEAAGGRDLSRAAERTRDPLLRRLFLRHAVEEQGAAFLFRGRGRGLVKTAPHDGRFEANWLAPGERGLEQLQVDAASDESLLAFLHLSEKAAAGRFALYGHVLHGDPDTRTVFARAREDDVFHMNYTRTQLARLGPRQQALRLWQARAGRLWKAYLPLAGAPRPAAGP